MSPKAAEVQTQLSVPLTSSRQLTLSFTATRRTTRVTDMKLFHKEASWPSKQRTAALARTKIHRTKCKWVDPEIVMITRVYFQRSQFLSDQREQVAGFISVLHA